MALCSATYLRGRQRRRCQSANSRAHSAQDALVCPGFEVQITLYQSCALADSTRWHSAAQQICKDGSDGAVKVRTSRCRIQPQDCTCMSLHLEDTHHRCLSLAIRQYQHKVAFCSATNLQGRQRRRCQKRYPAGPIQHRMHLYDPGFEVKDHAVSLLRFGRQRKVAWCSATYLRGR